MSGGIKKTQPFTVFVEGNIGSGKTTFLKHFAALDNVATLAEPVELWRNVRGENFLVCQYLLISHNIVNVLFTYSNQVFVN